MYYNSSSNDYYNSYKQELAELQAHKKEESTQTIIKLFLSLLIILFFILTTFYLYKYFNPSFPQEKETSTILIREASLPISIQMKKFNQQISNKRTEIVKSTISEKEIELIVKIIMSQISAKVEKPLEEQLHDINNKNFVNKSLKESNHYNKIVLTKNEILEVKNASLMQLSSNLSDLINEESNANSKYTQEITKEVIVRKNEMRIIIVQKGDTLSKIAKKAYGTYSDYRKILAANPEIIKNPNQIFVGQRIRIPS